MSSLSPSRKFHSNKIRVETECDRCVPLKAKELCGPGTTGILLCVWIMPRIPTRPNFSLSIITLWIHLPQLKLNNTEIKSNRISSHYPSIYRSFRCRRTVTNGQCNAIHLGTSLRTHGQNSRPLDPTKIVILTCKKNEERLCTLYLKEITLQTKNKK